MVTGSLKFVPVIRCHIQNVVLLIWSTGNLDKQHVTKAIICCDLRAFQYPFVLCDTFLLSALCFIRVGRV